MPVHGKNTSFKLDNAAGTLTDISTKLNSLDFPGLSAETTETSTFGNTSKTFVVGLKSGTISFEGHYDATIDAHLVGVVAKETISFEYGPMGTATGNPKYTGEAILTEYSVKGDIGSDVTFSGSLQITGDVTRGTF